MIKSEIYKTSKHTISEVYSKVKSYLEEGKLQEVLGSSELPVKVESEVRDGDIFLSFSDVELKCQPKFKADEQISINVSYGEQEIGDIYFQVMAKEEKTMAMMSVDVSKKLPLPFKLLISPKLTKVLEAFPEGMKSIMKA